MKIRILESAKEDLKEGFYFYELQRKGVGKYFLEVLSADIGSLRLSAGVHSQGRSVLSAGTEQADSIPLYRCIHILRVQKLYLPELMLNELKLMADRLDEAAHRGFSCFVSRETGQCACIIGMKITIWPIIARVRIDIKRVQNSLVIR